MTALKLSPDAVARRVDALRRASGRFDILDCETALQVADVAEALSARLAEVEAEIKRREIERKLMSARISAQRKECRWLLSWSNAVQTTFYKCIAERQSLFARAETAETNATRLQELHDLDEVGLDQLAGRLAAAEAEILRLLDVLGDIAKQKLTTELETDYEADYADFETGYDECVKRARAAIKGDQP